MTTIMKYVLFSFVAFSFFQSKVTAMLEDIHQIPTPSLFKKPAPRKKRESNYRQSQTEKMRREENKKNETTKQTIKDDKIRRGGIEIEQKEGRKRKATSLEGVVSSENLTDFEEIARHERFLASAQKKRKYLEYQDSMSYRIAVENEIKDLQEILKIFKMNKDNRFYYLTCLNKKPEEIERSNTLRHTEEMRTVFPNYEASKRNNQPNGTEVYVKYSEKFPIKHTPTDEFK